MTMRSLSRTILICIAAAALNSCSYGYDINAIAKNGAVVFTINSSGLFGSRTPYVNYVLLDRIGKPTKQIWKLERKEPNGPEVRELRYGETPPKMKASIGPAPLAIGQLYRVDFLTIDGGGYREFAISDDGEVLNFRR
jgi:hypothetical protein